MDGMLIVYDVYEGCRKWIEKSTVAQVIDQGTHHGARACIKLTDGKFVHTSEDAQAISKQMDRLALWKSVLEWYADNANYRSQPLANDGKLTHIPINFDGGSRAMMALES